MTQVLLNTLFPVFAGLLLGYFAGRRGTMDNLNVRNLIVLVMSFAIPCALFSTIIGSSRADLLRHIPAALMITLVFCALYLISYMGTQAARLVRFRCVRTGSDGWIPKFGRNRSSLIPGRLWS